MIIEAAHRLMRYEDRWLKLACQLRRRGKHPCVIAVAVANRFIRQLFHQTPISAGR